MDPYVYPGTTVLRNFRDIRDPAILAKFEMDMTTRRLAELESRRRTGGFDIDHLLEIHRYIFQDVFPWAGTFRTVDIARSGQFYFAFPDNIAPCLAALFAALSREPLAIDAVRFGGRAAHYLSEINAVHPFRDGNGRAQREFIRQFGLSHGFRLDWTRTTRERMYVASRLSFERADNSGLEELLLQALG
jgi:cell filamentation protein